MTPNQWYWLINKVDDVDLTALPTIEKNSFELIVLAFVTYKIARFFKVMLKSCNLFYQILSFCVIILRLVDFLRVD